VVDDLADIPREGDCLRQVQVVVADAGDLLVQVAGLVAVFIVTIVGRTPLHKVFHSIAGRGKAVLYLNQPVAIGILIGVVQ